MDHSDPGKTKMILLILAILFTIGAGMVAFSNREDIRRTGLILEFVSALVFTITLLLPIAG